MTRTPGHISHAHQRGITLIEVAVSILIVGGLLVAALNTLGASRMSQLRTADDEHAHMLAQQLIAEIIAQPYEDPDVQTSSLGLEEDVSAQPTARTLYDDVDDYAGWSSSPPCYKDGSAIEGLSDWQRAAEVVWVSSDDLETPVSTETGIKRIGVTVKRGEVILAELTTLRTRTADRVSELREEVIAP